MCGTIVRCAMVCGSMCAERWCIVQWFVDQCVRLDGALCTIDDPVGHFVGVIFHPR